MFQNITRDFKAENQNDTGETIKKNKPVKEILKNLFSIQNIILYIISFLISMVGFSQENLILSITPFAISFLAAMLSNYLPIGIVYIKTWNETIFFCINSTSRTNNIYKLLCI